MKLQIDLKTGTVYFPGQTLSGNLIISSPQPVRCKGLFLSVRGETKVSWIGNDKHGKYKECDELLNTNVINIQPKRGSNKISLEEGDFTIPFNFKLPELLPSSFTGEVGRVTYTITAAVKQPWNKSDIVETMVFSVVGIVDLRSPTLSKLRKEFYLEKSKTRWFWVCKSGPVGIRVFLPRTAYVPGEKLSFSAEIFNNSGVSVEESDCEFLQKCVFHAEVGSKKKEVVIRKIKGPRKVRSGDSLLWDKELCVFRIPPVQPTGLGGCHLIDLQYSLQFKILLGDYKSTEIKAEVPIFIGTVPFKTNVAVDHKNEKDDLGCSCQIHQDEEERQTQKVIPAYTFRRSVVHLGCLSDYEDCYSSNSSSKNLHSISSDVKNYHPFCIFFDR